MLTKKQMTEARKLFAASGGKAGGPARAAALSPARRKEIASLAGKASAAKRKKKPA